MVRKVSQSRQPKVGRLCTATKPSYPCHLWERHVSLGWRSGPGGLQGGEKLPARPGCALPRLLPSPVGSLAFCDLLQASPHLPHVHVKEGPHVPRLHSCLVYSQRAR